MKMIRPLIGVLLLIGLISLPFSVVAGHSSIEVGDYWEYSGTATFPGSIANVSIAYRMEITGESTRDIDGVSTPVLESRVTLDPMSSSSGGFNLTQKFVYVKSNFSLVSTSATMSGSLYDGGPTLLIHSEDSYDPPFDQFVGDDSLTVGKQMTARTTVTSSGWTNFWGLNTTQPISSFTSSVTLEVVAANVPVTVPAGTFNCYKIKVTSNETSSYSYYSGQAGYYVKMEESGGEANGGLQLAGTTQLVAYSYGGSGGMLSVQTITAIGGLVAVVALAAIGIALHMRRRQGKEPATVPTPLELQSANSQAPLTPGQAP